MTRKIYKNDYECKVGTKKLMHPNFYKKFKKVSIEETKCKMCNVCEKLTYHRILRNGKCFMFDYCRGNASFVNLSKWGPRRSEKKYYAVSLSKIDGKVRQFHTLFKLDHNLVLDHVDGNTLNDMLKNLRECTHSENMKNKHTSKLYGKLPYE